MFRLSESRFALRLAGVEHGLDVVRLRGRERINGLYRYDLEVLTSRRVAADQRALLGRAATLTLARSDGSARRVHGVIVAQRVDGHPAPGDLRHVHARLAPRMWLMGRRERSRVFHRMSPVAIVATLFREWGIDVEARVAGRQVMLEHCVQHRESDLAFVERLLARHGVAWWFQHPDAPRDETAGDATTADLGGVTIAAPLAGDGPDGPFGRERVVLSDRAEHYDAVGGANVPSLRFADARDDSHHSPRDVRAFAVESRVRPTAAQVMHYQPSHFQPVGAQHPTDRADTRAGRREPASAEESLRLEVDTHEAELAPFDGLVSGARVLLDRARADATRCAGESGAVDLAPGHRFELTDHPYDEVNRAWVVTEVTHRAQVAEAATGDAPAVTYENRFRCAPSGTLVRPAYRRPRRGIGVESATVVGTPDDDVYADACGRIKVRFHWDRRRLAHEDERSCYVRKTEAWAGAGWGAQFTPRPGMEVLVAFLDGDVDQPVVVGALYNEHNQLAFAREEGSRRSGFRTRSIGGEGHNELSFEDLAGREQVYVRAQRDLRARVRHDLDVEVRGDQRSVVGGAASTTVEHGATVSVGRDLHLTVAGDHREEVGGGHVAQVHGTRQDDVGGRLITSVGRDQSGTVGGDLSLQVAGAVTLEASGAAGATVGVRGPLQVVGEHVTLEARAGLTLRCGDAHITLTHDRIEVVAPHVIVRGEDRVLVEGEAASLSLDAHARLRGDEASVRSQGASLRLTSDAALEGAQVHLGTSAASDAGSDATHAAIPDEARTFTVATVARNAEGEAPVGHLRILDGERRTVRLVPAAEGREDGELLVFTLPVESLPDPVEIVYELGEYTEHLIGPVSPALTHDALMRRRAQQVAGAFARPPRRPRTNRRRS